MARLFGDENEVMVFSEDIVIDHDDRELKIKTDSKGAETADTQTVQLSHVEQP